MKKPFNPLMDKVQDIPNPVLVSSQATLETSANNEVVKVVCGPLGVNIPAQVHVDSRTVTPILC